MKWKGVEISDEPLEIMRPTASFDDAGRVTRIHLTARVPELGMLIFRDCIVQDGRLEFLWSFSSGGDEEPPKEVLEKLHGRFLNGLKS